MGKKRKEKAAASAAAASSEPSTFQPGASLKSVSAPESSPIPSAEPVAEPAAEPAAETTADEPTAQQNAILLDKDAGHMEMESTKQAVATAVASEVVNLQAEVERLDALIREKDRMFEERASQLRADVETANADLAVAESEMHDLVQKLGELEKAEKSASDELETARAEISRLSMAVSGTQDAMTQNSAENQHLRTLVQEKDRELERIKRTNEKELSDKDTSLKAVVAERAQLQERVTSSQEDVSRLQGEVSALTKINAEMEARMAKSVQAERDLVQVVDTLGVKESKIMALTDELEDLKLAISHKAEKLEDAEARLERRAELQVSYESEIQALKDSAESREQELNRALAGLEKADEKIRELEANLRQPHRPWFSSLAERARDFTSRIRIPSKDELLDALHFNGPVC